MQQSNMLYNVNDQPPIGRLFITALQQLCSVLVATILIPAICGVSVAPALVGAGIGTLVYQLFTRRQSPMFISSAGGFVAAVIGALSLGQAPNFTAVVIGGAITMIIYVLVGATVARVGVDWLNRLMPPIIIGPVVTLIGLNLATFIPTYFQVNGQYSLVGIALGFIALVIAACISHYGKGFVRNLPFLVAIGITYVIALLVTILGIYPVIDLSAFNGISLFSMPDFTFFHLDFVNFDWSLLPQVMLLYAPISFVCIAEHIADHKALSSIIGKDLIEYPGLGATLVGDGVASFFGSLICSLNNTSYGESVGTTGFSRVAYKGVITLTAVFAIILGFVAPVQAFFVSIPSCIFGGVAAILYGVIACSGIKVLANSNIDYNDNKNITVISVIFTLGVSGLVIDFGWISFTTTALALIVGIILNAVLSNKN